MSEFNLDREQNIANNIDATGKKWETFRERGSGLCFTRPNPDRKDAVIPDGITGRFTKMPLLNAAIKRYLQLNWDEADAIRAKNARTEQAALENPEVVIPSAAPVAVAVDEPKTKSSLFSFNKDS